MLRGHNWARWLAIQEGLANHPDPESCVITGVLALAVLLGAGYVLIT
jgi:hypothetical protein